MNAGFNGSHSLVSALQPIPETIDIIGIDYPRPDFPRAAGDELAGVRVLVLCADGAELPEIIEVQQFLESLGAKWVVAGQDWIFEHRDPRGVIVVAQWLKPAGVLQADLRMSDVVLSGYDALYVPGGAWNPDMLRQDEVAIRLVRGAFSAKKLVASICHGPQVFIDSAAHGPHSTDEKGEEILAAAPERGTKMTGTVSIRQDLRNAGFVVSDGQPVVYDEAQNLLTSREPNDLGPFCLGLQELLKQELTGVTDS